MTSLVIVESPAKARTLQGILGKGYRVEASIGHIRDLAEKPSQLPQRYRGKPWAQFSVDLENGFEPIYVIPADSRQQVQKLKAALEGSDELIVATDEDREGESIGWHVVEVLEPQVPVKRIVFHEITDEAIHAALEEPRDIDDHLVRAQESRRILDRLFGYELSPLLWGKVRKNLSAGRVQSVAVRLLVERERERAAFVPAVWFDAEARFEKEGQAFTARLVRLGGEKLAEARDFDAATGELSDGVEARWFQSRDEVQQVVDGWRSPWRVLAVESRPQRRRPAPPFTTSTLQQEANRKLGFSARRTMRAAQRLYEGVEVGGETVGLITYMRTDSVHLAGRALDEAQGLIRRMYGDAYTDGPRFYRAKSQLAQEAHEAIRPTELARTPDRVAPYVGDDERRLYELIWKRTLASQMTDARLELTTAEIEAPVNGSRAEAAPDTTALPGVFTASGKTIRFPGFLRAYVEGSDDPDAELGDRESILPELTEDEELDPLAVDVKEHETRPPARFTEASLVKKLEEEGIGRPSTYASILEKIQDRGYAMRQEKALVPTFTAFAVTELLEHHFRDYVDTGFTARMEEQLDEIARGQLDWRSYLERFYLGAPPEAPGLKRLLEEQKPQIEYPALRLGEHPETNGPIRVRVGQWGPYLQYEPPDGEAVNVSLPEELAPAELTLEEAVRRLEVKQRGPQSVGTDPETGEEVYLLVGRFGPYVQLGETPERGSRAPKPRRASLPDGFPQGNVTLELALKWLSLPRTLGEHPESGEPVLAKSGPYGPYVECGKERRSLEDSDDVYAIGLERALELLAQPKRRRGQKSQRKVLRELGDTPGGKPLQLLDGRYGPYLTDGEKNASLRKGEDPERLEPEEAQRIFAERAKPPKRKRKGKKKA